MVSAVEILDCLAIMPAALVQRVLGWVEIPADFCVVVVDEKRKSLQIPHQLVVLGMSVEAAVGLFHVLPDGHLVALKICHLL